MPDSASASNLDPNPLQTLLRECVVGIACDGEFKGTGFFVAPGEVVSCAHVVHAATDVSVFRSGWESAAEVTTRLPRLEDDSQPAGSYPLPDLAVLRVAQPAPRQPSVRLSRDPPRGGADPGRLSICGFSRGAHQPGVIATHDVLVEFESVLSEAEWSVLKFRGGQIVSGFSGAPLLDLRTGSVCGLVDSTRGETSSLGGFAVPVSVLDAECPGLLDRGNDPDTERAWDEALRGERRFAARQSGEERKLPLLEPWSELDWSQERAPSDLLKPRYGVVGMVGRERIQAELRRWRDGDDRLGIALLSGGGGYGKTRLALEECGAAMADDWTAGQLVLDASADADAALNRLVDWEGPLFVAIDYAETRPALVSSLILRLARRNDGAPARLLLLCRQAETGEDAERLFAVGDGRDEVAGALRGAMLVPLRSERVDRRRLFAAGAEAIADRLGVERPPNPAPQLTAEHFSRPLFVLAAALLSVTDPSLDIDAMSGESLLLELLERHECEYWRRWSETLGTDLDLTLQSRAVAVATAMGADTEAEALSLVEAIPELDELTAERRLKVARWLAHLYGNGRLDQRPAVSPIEPDMLGEALVRRESLRRPELIARALDAASDAQLAHALNVFARASSGEGTMAGRAREALEERLQVLVQRAAEPGPVRSELAAALELAVATLRPQAGVAEAAVRARRAGPALAGLAAALFRPAVQLLRDADDSDPPRRDELAGLLNGFCNALDELGRVEEALVAIEEAVEIRRALVDAGLSEYRPALADSLNDLAAVLNRLGHHERALPPIEEAVGDYRQLVKRDRKEHLPKLSGSLINLSNSLAAVSGSDAALPVIEEAVEGFRESMERDPGRHMHGLATALGSLSDVLPPERWKEEALPVIEEAVGYCRELVRRDRERYLPALAGFMGHLSIPLNVFGSGEEALSVIEVAVRIRRELVEEGLTQYLPALAESLNTQATLLGQMRMFDEALAAIEEAIDAYRELTEHVSNRYLELLALSLGNLSTILRGMERGEEALAAIEAEIERNEGRPGVDFLRLCKAESHFDNGDLATAFEGALPLLGEPEGSDGTVEADAAFLLRQIRSRDEAGFDSLWQSRAGRPMPEWLRDLESAPPGYELIYRQPEEDRAGAPRNFLAEWLSLAGDEFFEYLEEHSAELLVPRVEEALYDAALLDARRSVLFFPVGLLTLAKLSDPSAAIAALDEMEPLEDGDCLKAAEDPRTLAAARIWAGFETDDPDTQFQHAIAAAIAGHEKEAAAAIARCRELLLPWEASEYLSRIERLADSEDDSAPALAPLRRLLAEAGSDG